MTGVNSFGVNPLDVDDSGEPKQATPVSGVLTTNDVSRFSRQIIVAGISTKGQHALKNAKVLVVGVGGLGSPCLTYLATSGVGEITIIDWDVVEISNLHRQILHSEQSIGKHKVDSAKERLESLNSEVKIIPMKIHLNSINATQLFSDKKFDVVVDGTDNVATRYLLNDICVIHKTPLVSGSALQMEGQLTIYNHLEGPCYRCLYPKPPPPESVTSCGDSGILGPVAGVIGGLQAIETIKILTGNSKVLTRRLLIFDADQMIFRNIMLRARRKDCAVCGDNPIITSLIDYEEFCNASAHDKVINISILTPEENIDASTLSCLEDKILLDVRPCIEFEMCHINGSINIPFTEIKKMSGLLDLENALKDLPRNPVYIICRRGNDSQRAYVIIKEHFLNVPDYEFYNVGGGLYAYAEKVDDKFPVY